MEKPLMHIDASNLIFINGKVALKESIGTIPVLIPPWLLIYQEKGVFYYQCLVGNGEILGYSEELGTKDLEDVIAYFKDTCFKTAKELLDERKEKCQ